MPILQRLLNIVGLAPKMDYLDNIIFIPNNLEFEEAAKLKESFIEGFPPYYLTANSKANALGRQVSEVQILISSARGDDNKLDKASYLIDLIKEYLKNNPKVDEVINSKYQTLHQKNISQEGSIQEFLNGLNQQIDEKQQLQEAVATEVEISAEMDNALEGGEEAKEGEIANLFQDLIGNSKAQATEEKQFNAYDQMPPVKTQADMIKDQIALIEQLIKADELQIKKNPQLANSPVIQSRLEGNRNDLQEYQQELKKLESPPVIAKENKWMTRVNSIEAGEKYQKFLSLSKEMETYQNRKSEIADGKLNANEVYEDFKSYQKELKEAAKALRVEVKQENRNVFLKRKEGENIPSEFEDSMNKIASETMKAEDELKSLNSDLKDLQRIFADEPISEVSSESDIAAALYRSSTETDEPSTSEKSKAGENLITENSRLAEEEEIKDDITVHQLPEEFEEELASEKSSLPPDPVMLQVAKEVNASFRFKFTTAAKVDNVFDLMLKAGVLTEKGDEHSLKMAQAIEENVSKYVFDRPGLIDKIKARINRSPEVRVGASETEVNNVIKEKFDASLRFKLFSSSKARVVNEWINEARNLVDQSEGKVSPENAAKALAILQCVKHTWANNSGIRKALLEKYDQLEVDPSKRHPLTKMMNNIEEVAKANSSNIVEANLDYTFLPEDNTAPEQPVPSSTRTVLNVLAPEQQNMTPEEITVEKFKNSELMQEYKNCLDNINNKDLLPTEILKNVNKLRIVADKLLADVDKKIEEIKQSLEHQADNSPAYKELKNFRQQLIMSVQSCTQQEQNALRQMIDKVKSDPAYQIASQLLHEGRSYNSVGEHVRAERVFDQALKHIETVQVKLNACQDQMVERENDYKIKVPAPSNNVKADIKNCLSELQDTIKDIKAGRDLARGQGPDLPPPTLGLK